MINVGYFFLFIYSYNHAFLRKAQKVMKPNSLHFIFLQIWYAMIAGAHVASTITVPPWESSESSCSSFSGCAARWHISSLISFKTFADSLLALPHISVYPPSTLYISLAASSCLRQRPYITLLVIFSLLTDPSTNPFDRLLLTAFSTIQIYYNHRTHHPLVSIIFGYSLTCNSGGFCAFKRVINS